MGLDMYLNAKRYVSPYFNKDDGAKQKAIAELFPELSGRPGKFGDPSPVKEITIEAGYWRKANAIHDWFVRKVQGGEDECRPHYVGREQLEELRDSCQKVLDNREQAAELLPTASGFFFGGTNYDEYYFESLEHTIKVIDDALTLPDSWDFEYRSSW